MIHTLSSFFAVSLALAPLTHATSLQDDPPEVEDGTLEILVVDEEGEGVFEVIVLLLATEAERAQKKKGGTTRPQERTDPDGFATLPIPPGETRTIRVMKFGVTDNVTVELEPFAAGETRELTVEVKTRPDLTVEGRIVHAVDGAPIEGVELYLAKRAGLSFGGPSRPLDVNRAPAARTDAEGRFSIEVKSWGQGLATLVGEGWSPMRVALLRDGEPRRLDPPIRLRRAAMLRGRVVADDPATLTVIAETRSYHLMEEYSPGLTTPDTQFRAGVDSDGRFQFGDLPSATPLEVRVVRGRETLLCEADERTLPAGEVTEIVLTVGAGRAIRGVALESDGEPAAGLEVWLVTQREGRPGLMESYWTPHKRTRTDAEGRYEFADVTEGKWTVGLAPLDRRAEVSAEEAHAAVGHGVEVADADVEQRIEVQRGLYIEGTLLDPDGELLTAHASVRCSGGGMWVHDSNVRDGHFRVGPLPKGTWKLEAHCNGRLGKVASARLLAPSEQVVTDAGASDVKLRLRLGGTLSGVAVDAASGEPVPAKCRLTYGSAWRSLGMKPEDTFDFPNLAPGHYVLVASTADGRVGYAPYDIEPGDVFEEQEVLLGPGGFVEVRYDGPKPYGQVEIVCDGVVYDFNTLQSGSSEQFSAPTGEVTVRVYSGLPNAEGVMEFEELRKVTVTAGKVTNVDVVIEDE